MARRVFFSFHYERDIWRASQVRNSWLTKPDRESAGFWDSASWEEVKKKGDDAIERWVRGQIKGTTVTAVLIGAQTASRSYVQYELEHSLEVGNGLFGIYIHNLKDSSQSTDMRGVNPFVKLGIKNVATYDWINDDGYDNLAQWVDDAYAQEQE